MSLSYETSGTILAVGITAAEAAGEQGPQINVAGFRVGSDSAQQGAVALTTDTDVANFVYAGTEYSDEVGLHGCEMPSMQPHADPHANV